MYASNASHIALYRPDGSATSIGEHLGKPLLLIFLRHLG